MVHLVLTPQGLQEILAALPDAENAMWCSADALSEDEFDKLRRGNMTRFDYSLADADQETIAGAIATIEEHHPGERIWVESVAFGT